MKNLITGIILSGGMARRMGGKDKGLIKIADKPLIEYVIDALHPQVNSLIISANRNLDCYLDYGIPVIADSISGYHGPLAGMASCMRVIETEFMLTVPCDSPNLPDDFVARMYNRLIEEQAEISVAHDGELMQPVFSIMQTNLLDSLLDYLNSDDRKIGKWFRKHKLATVDFSDKLETFININTFEDIDEAETVLNKR